MRAAGSYHSLQAASFPLVSVLHTGVNLSLLVLAVAPFSIRRLGEMWRSALRVRARTCHTVTTVVIDHRGVKGVRRTVSHRTKIGPALEGKTSVCLPRRLGGILARHEPTNYWSGGDRRVLGADAGRVCEPAGRDVLWWALRQHRLRRCRRLHCRTSWCCLGVPGVNG